MKKVQLLFLVAAAVFASACTKEEAGQLAYSVNLDRVGGLQTVTVTVGYTGLAVTAEVTQVTELSGVLEDVPAGSHLVSAAAYAAGASQAAAEVSATVTIVDGEVAVLALVLGSSDIASIIASNTTPHVGEMISLTAELADGSTPQLIWSDDCAGDFSRNASAEVEWSAAAAGDCNISVQVASSAVSAASVAVKVGLAPGTEILIAGTGQCIGHADDEYDDGATRVTYNVWGRNGYYIDEKGTGATTVGFDRIYGVDLDKDGRVVFADRNGGRIFRVEKDGTLMRLAGVESPQENGGVAFGKASENDTVYYPMDVVVDDATGDILFTEVWGYRVKRIYAADNTIAVVAGAGSWSNSDYSNSTTLTNLSAYLTGLAMDSDGNVYIAGTYQWSPTYNKIDKIYAGSNTKDTISRSNPYPWDIEVHDGYIYFTDRFRQIVGRMTTDGGAIETLVGEQDRAGFDGDGAQGKRTLVNDPRGLFVDSDGTVFFSDSGNTRIRKLDKDGIVHTVQDNVNVADFVIDSSRNIVMADIHACSVKKIIGPF